MLQPSFCREHFRVNYNKKFPICQFTGNKARHKHAENSLHANKTTELPLMHPIDSQLSNESVAVFSFAPGCKTCAPCLHPGADAPSKTDQQLCSVIQATVFSTVHLSSFIATTTQSAVLSMARPTPIRSISMFNTPRISMISVWNG